MSWRDRWLALAVVLLPVLLISIDITVLSIALPQISEHLAPTSSELLWVVDSYSFLLACLLIVMGKVGDRYGRLHLLVVGAIVFGAASALSGLATSPLMLIAGRCLQGIGGATLMPSTLGLIRHIFSKRAERRLALALWSAAFSGGTAIGPLVGGLLIEHSNWRAVFFINVPVVILFVVLARKFVPESDTVPHEKFEFASPALLMASLFAMVFAFKSLLGEVSPLYIGILVVGVGVLVLFWRRQHRLKEPFLDPDVIAQPVFLSATVINGISFFITVGVLFFFPQYLMLVVGMSAFHAGLWATPMVIATIVGALISPIVARTIRANWLVAIGMAITAVGCFLSVLLGPGDFDILIYTSCTLLIGLGVGVAEPLTNDFILSSAPEEDAGSVSAISETAYELGGALGTALLGGIGLFLYRGSLAEDLAKLGINPADTGGATDTLGGAIGYARTLDGNLADALTWAAQGSFMDGESGAMIIAGASSVVAVIIALWGMRASMHLPQPDQSKGTPTPSQA